MVRLPFSFTKARVIELVLYNAVAAQNFEDKAPDILDKQHERHASA